MENEKIVKLINKIIKSLLLTILTVGFTLGIFLLICLFIPIYITRFLVSKLKFFGPKLGKMVSASGTCLAVDDIYTNPKCTILVPNIIKEDFPDIENLRQLIMNRIISVFKNKGEFQYEELQQYPYQWMGFLFWKWENSFDISQHIYDYSSAELNQNHKISEDELRKIQTSLLLKPFEKKKSPWEIIVIRNLEFSNGDLGTGLFIRCHHSLGDGFSIMKLTFTALVDNGMTSMEKFLTLPAAKNSKCNRIVNFCKMFLLAPYQYAKYTWESFDNNEWILPSKENKDKSKFIMSFSETIKLDDLKEIAKRHKVCLTAVIYAAFAAAMHKTMKRKSEKVPKYINLSATVPKPGHPNELRNHLAFIFVRLPVGDFSPLERLHKVQKSITMLKNSAIPAISFFVMPIIGALFPFMTKYIVGMPVTTTLSSSFPGPKQKISICGKEIDQCYFLLGPVTTNFAVNYHTFTYADGFRFIITSHNSLINEQAEVEEMVKAVQEEFQILKNGHEKIW